eukprot:COSAG05_NODE_2320_length_3240_cov_2.007641_5_plen_78_part_00
MTEIYLYFLFSHYGLYANTPVVSNVRARLSLRCAYQLRDGTRINGKLDLRGVPAHDIRQRPRGFLRHRNVVRPTKKL